MTAVARRPIAQPDREFQDLVRRTYAGNPAALTALGLRLIAGRDAPHSPADGEALLAEAAHQDDGAAWFHLATLSAAGAVRPQCWPSAWDALRRAADLGHQRAAEQLTTLTHAGLESAEDVCTWLGAPRFRIIREDPRITACENFIDPHCCAHLMTLATPWLAPARVYDVRERQLRLDPMRSNRNAALSVADTDVITQLIRARCAVAAGLPLSNLEPPEVLHYAPGESYRLHVDFFHVSVAHFAELVRESGQRTRTLLIYLNDDYEGGATEFPKLDLKFRGRPGEALLFENVLPDGEGDMRTVHSGTPVISGSKWLFSQWMRDRAQPVA